MPKRRTRKDKEGRITIVEVPDDAPSSHDRYGIEIGPPDLSELGLPPEIEVRLNNELYHRGIITRNDAIKRRNDVLGALQAALKIHVQKVIEAYG